MKTTNENVVQKVLDYIKDFQLKEGRSPSFRQICKAMNFPSLGSAQRYVRILQTRGLIEKSNTGRIITPFNLSKDETIIAPLVGSVACGQPIYAEQNIEKVYELPQSLFGKGELFGLTAQGNSMTGVGIFDGDTVFYTPCNEADNGQIVVALIEDSATIKTLERKKDCVLLHPANPDYPIIKITEKELRIQGIVKSVVHCF